MIQTSKIPEMIDPQSMYSTNGQEAWRVLGIMAEFAVATESLRGIRPAVSMFGSARIRADHPYYSKAGQPRSASTLFFLTSRAATAFRTSGSTFAISSRAR